MAEYNGKADRPKGMYDDHSVAEVAEGKSLTSQKPTVARAGEARYKTARATGKCRIDG